MGSADEVQDEETRVLAELRILQQSVLILNGKLDTLLRQTADDSAFVEHQKGAVESMARWHALFKAHTRDL